MKLRKYTEEDVKKVIGLYESGMEVKDILAETKVSHSTFWRWIKGKTNRCKQKADASPETIQQAITMYKNGCTSKEISRVTGYHKQTVEDWLHRAGVEMRHRGPQSKIQREDFFDEIDSEEKAYYLGWLMADGNISINNGQYSIKIHICTEDEDTIIGFLNAIQSSNKINRKIQKDRQGNECYSSYVSLTSKHMCQSLMKLGIIPNKTGKESFPDISQEFRAAFLRGFFDGDGITCIGKRKRSGFISSRNMLIHIQELIGLEKTIHHPPNTENPNVDYFHLGKHDSKILYDFIYDNATVWMKRKRERLAIVCGNTEITA